MKKRGFTLAEALITLGIIGVVMALMTPELIHYTGTANVGPALRRAKTDFEEATALMLSKNGVDSISELGDNDDLQRFLKGTSRASYNIGGFHDGDNNFANAPAMRYDTESGITFLISMNGNTCEGENIIGNYPNIPSNQLVGNIYVDVNGNKRPNRIAKDIFMFFLYNDGTIRPNGVRDANRCVNEDGNANITWQDGNCDANSVHHPETCAGSIFENKFKVIYD